jgi:hypothetical protein
MVLGRIGVARKFCLFQGLSSETYRKQLPLQTTEMPEKISELHMKRTATL